jgi:hypothetical protein
LLAAKEMAEKLRGQLTSKQEVEDALGFNNLMAQSILLSGSIGHYHPPIVVTPIIPHSLVSPEIMKTIWVPTPKDLWNSSIYVDMRDQSIDDDDWEPNRLELSVYDMGCKVSFVFDRETIFVPEDWARCYEFYEANKPKLTPIVINDKIRLLSHNVDLDLCKNENTWDYRRVDSQLMLIATNGLNGVSFKNLYELIVHCECEVIGDIDEYLFPHIFNDQKKVDEILWHLKFKNNKLELTRAFEKLTTPKMHTDYIDFVNKMMISQFAVPADMLGSPNSLCPGGGRDFHERREFGDLY